MSTVDVAELVASLGARLREAGLPVGADRCARFAEALTLVRPRTTGRLRWCARATLAADAAESALLDRVLDEVLPRSAPEDPADGRGDPNAPARPGSAGAGTPHADGTSRRDAPETGRVPALASAEHRLSTRDFAELSEEELLVLADAMRRLRLATPPRRSRRTRPVPHGSRVDLRATLRRAHRSGGDPLELAHRLPRDKPRRLVALCDISGSMQGYARALLQLLYCAAGARHAEVFTFATRLTRLTPALAGTAPDLALARAGRAAPDWSGGTRIAPALAEFIDGYGRRGMARGAVVLIISDGWETGDPGELGRQMARLSRLAYRIVWANPRTQSPRYQPLVSGMAAAWPHCDAVVSAHRLDALDDLLAALAAPRRRLS